MRTCWKTMLGLAAALGAATAAQAASTAADDAQSKLILVAEGDRAGRDCTPYNQPYGFYGNAWCQPPSEQSYLRNLGSRWPLETPRSLRKPKPHDTGSDW